jgi:hypothetical protein
MNNFLSHFYHNFAGYGLPGTLGRTPEERAMRGMRRPGCLQKQEKISLKGTKE